MSAELVAWPAAVVTAGAVLVLVVGAVQALQPGRPTAPALAAHAGLSLELLLAAGLIRLAAVESLRGLATVAAIIALRRLLGRGIRAGVQAPGASAARATRASPGVEHVDTHEAVVAASPAAVRFALAAAMGRTAGVPAAHVAAAVVGR